MRGQPRRDAAKPPQFAQMDAQLEQAMFVERQHGRTAAPLNALDLFHHGIVGTDGGKSAAVNPVEQSLGAAVQPWAGGKGCAINIGAAFEQEIAIAGIKAQKIAGVDRGPLRLGGLHQFGMGDPAMGRLGGMAHVDQYAARTGLQVELDVPDEAAQPEANVATALFRILQESLTNIARHAEADSIRISLEEDDDAWLLAIRDNGVGFARDPGRGEGFGLIGMRERARNLGGQLSVSSLPGAGTTIAARIPKMEKQQG